MDKRSKKERVNDILSDRLITLKSELASDREGERERGGGEREWVRTVRERETAKPVA